MTPCLDCGWDKDSTSEYKRNKKTLFRCLLFNKFEATLCDFCMHDFDSYDPEVFGLTADSPLSNNYVTRVTGKVPHRLEMEVDKYCPKCFMRLKFIVLIDKIREYLRP